MRVEAQRAAGQHISPANRGSWSRPGCSRSAQLTHLPRAHNPHPDVAVVPRAGAIHRLDRAPVTGALRR
jgi:hypothetical protein